VITIGLLALGLGAGVLAGMFGIGGGVVIVPALLFFFKMEEKAALGTCLAALIPPVGLLGAMAYYQAGFMNIRYAGLLALGLLIGGFFGARLMLELPPDLVKRLYGGFLAVIAIRMLFFEK
jgi:uncharacterized protein